MFDTENFGLNRHHRHVMKLNIIMAKNSMGLKRMNTRLSKNQRRQSNQRWSTPATRSRSKRQPASSRSQRKSKSNLKQVGCNWKQAGCNSKPAANSLKPLVERA